MSQSRSPPRLDILYDIDGQNFKGKPLNILRQLKNNLHLQLFIFNLIYLLVTLRINKNNCYKK